MATKQEEHILSVILGLKQEVNDLKFLIAHYREELVAHKLICVECGRIGHDMPKPIVMVQGEPLCAACGEAYEYTKSLLCLDGD